MTDTSGGIESTSGLRGDPATARLRMYGMTWRDLLGTRLALQQRDMPAPIIDEFARLEKRVLEQLRGELRRHTMWPWLSQFPGLGGGHTALLMAALGDPHRFPGQMCTVGHYLRPGLLVGSPCPLRAPAVVSEIARSAGGADILAGTAESLNESESVLGCPGVMLPPRIGTGVRSLWHYLGLHVVEGRAPRKRKGQRTTWDPALKASLLGPMGIAEQIVRQRTEPYRGIYDAAKERITRERGIAKIAECAGEGGPPDLKERGAVVRVEIESVRGSADLERAQVVRMDGLDVRDGLRPFQIDALARKIAVKAFVGDLLIEWKRIT